MKKISGVTSKRNVELAIAQSNGTYRALRAELLYEQGKLVNLVADGFTWKGEPFEVVKKVISQDETTKQGRATLSRYHIDQGRLMQVEELGEVPIDLSRL